MLLNIDDEGPQDIVESIVNIFEVLSDGIRECEEAATFHGDPESVEQENLPDDLPSVEELERRKEIVLESARAIETTFAKVGPMRRKIETGVLAPLKRELLATGAAAEAAELDRQVLRAEWRKRVLGMGGDSSSPGDDVVPAGDTGNEG